MDLQGAVGKRLKAESDHNQAPLVVFVVLSPSETPQALHEERSSPPLPTQGTWSSASFRPAEPKSSLFKLKSLSLWNCSS